MFTFWAGVCSVHVLNDRPTGTRVSGHSVIRRVIVFFYAHVSSSLGLVHPFGTVHDCFFLHLLAEFAFFLFDKGSQLVNLMGEITVLLRWVEVNSEYPWQKCGQRQLNLPHVFNHFFDSLSMDYLKKNSALLRIILFYPHVIFALFINLKRFLTYLFKPT